MPRKRDSHIWEREKRDHYVEPQWCSKRLFEVEGFRGVISYSCCGFGTIVEAASGLVSRRMDAIWSIAATLAPVSRIF